MSGVILISKAAVIASFPVGSRTRVWLEGLPDSEWSVVNFTPQSRLVNAVLTNPSGVTVHFTLTLPVVSVSSLS